MHSRKLPYKVMVIRFVEVDITPCTTIDGWLPHPVLTAGVPLYVGLVATTS
jgi:hypothetical protein